jgi:hypothetical protein
MDQTIVSSNTYDLKDCLEAPSIGLAAYLLGWSLGFDEDFGSGVILTTGCTSVARFMNSGFSKDESIINITTLGLFSQLACHHFEMGFAIRISNALNTCYSMYLATRNSPANAERPAEKSRIVENKTDEDLDELIAEKPQLSESKRTKIWSVFAGLILIATIVTYLFASQPPTNDCMISTRKIDSTHWQAVVRADVSSKGCDVPTQMSLAAGEMRAYTRDINEQACSVSCIKQNNAGYWTAYVSITRSGGPVDGTYCGEAYSHGNCGQGLTRQRTG